MATNFPGSLDNGTSLPYPGALDSRNNPSLAGVESNQNDAVIATQTKLGIGASVAATDKLLIGTGAGASAWSGTAPASGLFVGTTDTQTLTNKTLTSPIINSPNITNATITADAYTGFTSPNSGTIFGVNIAAGKLNGADLVNNSVTNTQIATNTITYDRLTTDSSWAYLPFTATWGGITLGSATRVGYYKQIGRTVHFYASISLSGSTVTGTITLTLPVAKASTVNNAIPIGIVRYFDNAGTTYMGTINAGGSLFVSNTSSTYATESVPNATVPFTWGNSDVIYVSGIYEAA